MKCVVFVLSMASTRHYVLAKKNQQIKIQYSVQITAIQKKQATKFLKKILQIKLR